MEKVTICSDGKEIKAAKIQDEVRLDARVRKTGQPEFKFDNVVPRSRLSLDLRDRYVESARKRIIDVLLATGVSASIRYEDLFCEAMAYPLVTPDDLVDWLHALEPNITILYEGTRRKKPSPMKDDRIVVVNPNALL